VIDALEDAEDYAAFEMAGTPTMTRNRLSREIRAPAGEPLLRLHLRLSWSEMPPHT
jgi:hypothetical protein